MRGAGVFHEWLLALPLFMTMPEAKKREKSGSAAFLALFRLWHGHKQGQVEIKKPLSISMSQDSYPLALVMPARVSSRPHFCYDNMSSGSWLILHISHYSSYDV